MLVRGPGGWGGGGGVGVGVGVGWRGGGSDLTWLWAQPHAIEDLVVVELTASCESRFGPLTQG